MRLSIVDIAVVPPGETQVEALRHSVDLARRADRLGYSRYWVAEHHAARGQASYAPEVVIPAIAAATRRIHVGSGAVLLNHYSPFKVAETFRQLYALFPGRIDLGIGRATAGHVLDFALQRDRREVQRTGAAQDYGEQVSEVLAWLGRGFPEGHPFAASYPLMPDVAPGPPVWLLGSSPGSAAAAGRLGVPYTFAGFINPQQARLALDTYRDNFTPAQEPGALKEPHAMLGINAVCADTDEEAAYHAMTVHGLYHLLSTRGPHGGPLYLTPEEAITEMGRQPQATAPEDRWTTRSVAGSPDRIRWLIEAMAGDVGADEVIIQDMILDPTAREQSFRLLAEVFELDPAAAVSP